MRTVPTALADVLLVDLPNLRAAIAGCGQLVGERVEVDLDQVDKLAPAVGAALEAYAAATDRLWHAARAGTASGMAYQVTSRLVLDAHQVTGKVGRADLVDLFAAMSDVPAVNPMLMALTEPDPDDEPAIWTVERTPDGARVGTLTLEGASPWPTGLGGPPYAYEVGRTLRLTTRHAAWRDRRVRRLARVQLHVQELWPDPAATLRACVLS